jgi:hypothetical protein
VSKFPHLQRRAVAERLTNEYGEPIVLVPWLAELLDKIDAPAFLEYLLVLIRQCGKTTGLAVIAGTELLCVPNAYVQMVSASLGQSEATFGRKFRRPLERLLRDLGLSGAARFSATGVEIPALGSEFRVVAPNEATGAARTPTKLFIDEAKDVSDAVYAALAPSIIGVGGKIVIASTPGRPRGFFHELVMNPDSQTWLYRSAENDNPHADRGALEFLRRRLGLVSPSAMLRDLEGEFAEDGESLFPPELLASARDEHLVEVASSRLPAFGFLDLSRRRDLTTLAVAVRGPARRPEATDHLSVVSLAVWDPKQSPTGEVPFDEVRAALGTLPARFPNLRRLLIDEGAEGGAVIPFCRTHPKLSLVTEGFQASPASNMELWSSLSARLHGLTVSLPADARLFAELRGLRKEGYAYGSKWRVVDGSRRLHRDVSLAVAGACLAAGPILANQDAKLIDLSDGFCGTPAEIASRRLAKSFGLPLTGGGDPVVGGDPFLQRLQRG